ncbi:MAG: 4Fe-4S ferredoxin [Candidatus Zixiibacteriota bacterium]|nr:MAG: 4Fe-4S ferredoxin [candidate division Zixibacteria bacterium]HDL03213.1 4Fe-4S dicluster domain-containing protein [candidate division Zixibacteria bacterium]
MEIDRRKFLTIAGITAATTIGKKVIGDTTDVEQIAGLPQKSPLVGHRWAMVIDTRKCREKSGCTKCIDACHSAHNVPQFDNPKDEVKWIWKEHYKEAFPNQEHEHVKEGLLEMPAIVMCNHCDNPPCVRVCPTQSTWKRDDGIVMMDMHRCIGCRYCIAACPYGSRSFNWRDPRPFIKNLNKEYPTRTRGVVEKCNFCAERLAKGLHPACVDACEEKALVFGDLEDPESEVRALLRENYAIRRKPALGTNPEVYYIV